MNEMVASAAATRNEGMDALVAVAAALAHP